MATPGQPRTERSGGLTAAELAAACGELQALVGVTVVDELRVLHPAREGDVLLVLAPGLLARKVFLQVVAGGPTARLGTTARRWPKAATVRPQRLALVGARLVDVRAVDGERIAILRFHTEAGERQLIAELFGSRGLVVLADGDGRVLHTSRAVQTATRQLAEGDRYVAPQRGSAPSAPPAAPRFRPPLLAAIDEHFTRIDVHAEAQQRCERITLQAKRAATKARAKVDGIGKQLADVGRAAGLRGKADLMLAYQHTVRRGAPAMTVPDPERADAELTIELDPALPVVVQAQALYEKARRLDDSRAVNEARLQRATHDLATAERELAAANALAAQFTALTTDAPDLLERLAALPFPAEPEVVERAMPWPQAKPKPRDDTGGENVRRFVSAEGYPILVGRNNEQNDRLTMRIANGNDLWLHVGGGRAGSHVVVRLPKQKTASLETLLDAGTLAVHFSKARGQHRIDVVYTQRKHVKKPKGLPAGAVVPSQTKTITVVLDEGRLARLLGSMPED